MKIVFELEENGSVRAKITVDAQRVPPGSLVSRLQLGLFKIRGINIHASQAYEVVFSKEPKASWGDVLKKVEHVLVTVYREAATEVIVPEPLMAMV